MVEPSRLAFGDGCVTRVAAGERGDNGVEVFEKELTVQITVYTI